MPLSVRKLTSRIGAVVEGVDPASEPGPYTIAALRDALNEYKAIVFVDHPRRLNRVTIAGDAPVGVDGRGSEQRLGDASRDTSVPEVAA
ncbi:alpha-ketoglutarate-dependent taurine dioxygenase [Streptacidiphilus sp. MAP12-20]